MTPTNENSMSNALLLIGAGALVVGVVSLLIRRANRTTHRTGEPERSRQSLRGVPLPVRRTSTGSSSYSRSSDRRHQDDGSIHTGLFSSSHAHSSRSDDSPSHHSSGGYHTGGSFGGGSYDSGSSDSCSSSDSGGCGGGGD